MRWLMLGTMALCASACGNPASSSPTDVGSTADTSSAADTTTTNDATGGNGQDTPKGEDAGGSSVPCPARAGGYVVDGTCSNGGSSIPYACLFMQGCNMSWEADFRAWTGPLNGTTYKLASPKGDETIEGQFTSAEGGSYSYAGPKGLTCEAEFTRLEPTVGESPCCNPVGNDCGDGKACLPVQEPTDSGDIITTECLPVADSAVGKGKTCKSGASGQGCVAGTMCTATIGSGKGAATTCKALCVEAGQCGKGETCLLLTGTPKAGFCDTACDLFADPTATDACPDGGSCQPVSAIDGKSQPGVGSVCTAASKLGLGNACKGLDCSVGLTCSKGTCQPLCDDNHPCPDGKNCAAFKPAPLPPLAPSTGVCQ